MISPAGGMVVAFSQRTAKGSPFFVPMGVVKVVTEFSSSTLGFGGAPPVWMDEDVDFSQDSLSEAIRNDNGLIRLHKVREWHYSEDRVKLDLSEEVEIFLDWVDDDEYLEFKGTNRRTGDTKKKWLKSRKRGNDCYAYDVKKKTEWMNQVPDEEFFSGGQGTTPALFVTLTHDQSVSRDLAWEGEVIEKRIESGENEGKTYKTHAKDCPCISCEWNRFISAMRQKFGSCKVFRTYESTKSGYPHVHAILLFEGSVFQVKKHKSREDGKVTYRLKNYSTKEEIGDYWNLGFVDVQGVKKLRGIFQYLRKYLLKALAGKREIGKTIPEISDEGVSVTLTLCWLYHKQSYAISGKMGEFVFDLTTGQWLTQMDLEGNEVKIWEWELVRVVPCSKIWKSEKPPPWNLTEEDVEELVEGSPLGD